MKGFGLYLIILVCLLAGVSYVVSQTQQTETLSYNQIYNYFMDGDVDQYDVDDTTLTMHLKKENRTYTYDLGDYRSVFYNDLGETIQQQMRDGTLTKVDYRTATIPWWAQFLPYVILIVLLILVLAAGGCLLAIRKEINGSASAGEPVSVSIQQGSGVAAIAQKLKTAGVIKYPHVFRWYAGKQGAAGKLQYGEFDLAPGSSYDDIIEALSAYAKADSVRLTFPEGTTAIAIAKKMEDAGLCSAEDFLKEANTGDFSQYRFWQYVPDDKDAPDRFLKCEGYLFPDTYDFLKDDTVHHYVETFYSHFDKQITDEMYAEMEKQGMTLSEVVTLASFVQEEAGNDQDDNVAQVFRNRLAEGSPYPKLQSNTSSYVQSDADNNYLWNWVAPYYGGWDSIPENILEAYDTYACTGLSAGPISNPGIAAIRAALDPQPDDEAKDAYFFVTDLAGHYYYARTYADHQKNCDEAAKVNKSMK